jgi:hypothetical protein
MKFLVKASLLTFALCALCMGALAQSTGGIKGKVRDEKERGLAGVEIIVRQDGKDVKSTTTDRKGMFLLDGLKEGKYNIHFEKDGYSSGTLFKITVPFGRIRDLGDRLVLTVDKGTLTIVQGSVFDKDGFSLPGAKVQIARVTSGGGLDPIRTTYTQEDGEFIFKFTDSSATYRITATYKDSPPVSKDVVTEGAAVYRVALNISISRK